MHERGAEEVAGCVATVLFMLRLSIRLPDGRDIENEGVVLDVAPVGLTEVELPAGIIGTLPVEKGLVELALGTVPEDSGAVPADPAPVLLLREELIRPEVGADEPERGVIEVRLAVTDADPDAAAEENDGYGMEVLLVVGTGAPESGADVNEGCGIEVLLVVAALLEKVIEPPVALGTLTLDIPVDFMGLEVVLLELLGAEQPGPDEFALSSSALTVISSLRGVKLACLVLKKQLGPMTLG